MSDLPLYAISVRQPWAWAIVAAGKDLENRVPTAVRFMRAKMERGPLCIHASMGMTRDEYESARDFMVDRGLVSPERFPEPWALRRGGIIGTVHFDEVVSQSTSLWWIGPRALRLSEHSELIRPIPCGGALGFFEWRNSAEHCERNGVDFEKPKPWMIHWPGDAPRGKAQAKPKQQPHAPEPLSLFEETP